MSRCLVVIVLLAGFGVMPVSAQEPQALLPRALTLAAVDALPPPQPVAAKAAEAVGPAGSIVQLPANVQRPTTTLNVLCVSFAALQAVDLHTTFRALDNGAREGNPLLGGFASNKAAMIGFKAATTASTIYLVRKFGVRNRVASTIFMAAVNSAYAIIAAHNYRLAKALR